ncbi:MAG TPA: hypothetical protein ENJ80_00415 [Gammaproteobacteria bacterium]|nr:hypothetical protein [Gammaproteobacteria bacterium]
MKPADTEVVARPALLAAIDLRQHHRITGGRDKTAIPGPGHVDGEHDDDQQLRDDSIHGVKRLTPRRRKPLAATMHSPISRAMAAGGADYPTDDTPVSLTEKEKMRKPRRIIGQDPGNRCGSACHQMHACTIAQWIASRPPIAAGKQRRGTLTAEIPELGKTLPQGKAGDDKRNIGQA